jgi:UDP-glucose 4-epimerase
MRVVVTGGAGFIGTNLCRQLLADGDEVVVLDDLSTGSRRNLEGLDVEFHEGSILDRHILDKVLPGADAVVHLAALVSVPWSVEDPIENHARNATGTLEVLMAARRAGVDYVAVASSAAVYGANPELPKHERMVVAPMTPYAVTKVATEEYAIAFGYCYGMRTIAFRFFNVFGPLQPADHAYAAVIPAFVDAAVAGRALPLEGDGTQTRDFIYVGTVARVLADAVHRGVAHPEPVNLALGARTSLKELISEIEQGIGRPVEIDRRPARVGDVTHSQADASSLKSLFPDVEPVPIEQGLRETVRWFVRESARAAGQDSAGKDLREPLRRDERLWLDADTPTLEG